ncbi:MAG TPA: hypothetical protein VFF67_05285 [Thermoplasmata archaeon]|nr:hypothetical protein [Thermoplasmata archaeon]
MIGRARAGHGGSAGATCVVVGLLLLVGGLTARPVSPPFPGSSVRPSVSGGNPGSGHSNLTNYTVNATDAPSFIPNGMTVPAGNVLSLQLVNVGSYNHTFTLGKNGSAALNRSWSPAQLSAYFARNGSFENVLIPPGAHRWVNLTIPSNATGLSFEYVSLVPYQFQAGMFGFVNVTGAPAGPPTILQTNTTSSFSFTPDAIGSMPTHFPVAYSVLVTNLGALPHTFTVESQPNVTLQPSTFPQTFATNPPAANVNIPSSAGGAVWANFTITKPGIYEFICEVQGHFAQGMFGYLYAGVPIPVTSTPSTAIVQPVLLAGGGAILGLGIVLVVAATLSGRLPPRRAAAPHG